LADAPNVTVTCIVNDTTEVADTLATAWGRRPPASQRLQFSTYSVTELIEIVSKRAEHALGAGFPDEYIERIAAAADGDARLGICILREAVHHAGESFGIGLNEEHLQAGVESAHRELHQSNLERLTDHQRTLYDLLLEKGPLSPGALRERYADLVEEPRSRRTVVTYLQKMERYGLVQSEGSTRDKTYRVDTSGYANLETA
jgi:Cdc6-like AAA superfamily ATPase